MTHAVCVKCGAMKFGALVPCRTCGELPRTEIELAYAFVLTDHYVEVEELRKISDNLRQGGPLPSMSPEQETHFRRMARNALRGLYGDLIPALDERAREQRESKD